MNSNTGGSGRWGRSPVRRLGGRSAAVAAVALAAVALLATACGGGGDPSSGGHGSTYQKELAFSQCMRAHGEPNFPDPGSNGIIAIQGGSAPKGVSGSGHRTVGGAQMTRANNACRHLLPNGGVPTAAQKQQMLQQGLKFAECMRAHGISNFPDPKLGGGPVTIGGAGINIQSPQFQAAQRTCQKYVRGRGGSGGLQIAS